MSINEGYADTLLKLEEDKLYQQTVEIADKAYALAGQMPEEEKYGMASRLKQYGYGLTANIADALGSINPRDIEYYFGMARKDLFGLKNIVTTAGIIEIPVSSNELADKLELTLQELDKRIATLRKKYYESVQKEQKKS